MAPRVSCGQRGPTEGRLPWLVSAWLGSRSSCPAHGQDGVAFTDSTTDARLQLVVCFATAVTHRTPSRVVLPTADLVFRYV
jgi:hypothetical protein